MQAIEKAAPGMGAPLLFYPQYQSTRRSGRGNHRGSVRFCFQVGLLQGTSGASPQLG